MTLAASVVICAYTADRWGHIQRAVRSVLAQKQPVCEVILVIDHNAELLRRATACWPEGSGEATQPFVRVVANRGAQGLSGARNTGVHAARSDVVAFLDDDAEAEADWTERLLAPYSDPRVMACGGAAVARLEGARPAWWPLEFDWVVGCSWPGLPARQAAIRNLIGANMSARREVVLEVGGFTEGIGRIGVDPVGCEETEFCIRLSQRRPEARILYEPRARVHHTVPEERLSWRYFRSRCFAEGRSKAAVACRVGGRSALASERSYALRVLSTGALRGLVGACRGEPAAGLRALAIAAGLAITTAGYLQGRLKALAPSMPARTALARPLPR